MTRTLIQLHWGVRPVGSTGGQAANFLTASSMVEALVWLGFTQTRDTPYCLSSVVSPKQTSK